MKFLHLADLHLGKQMNDLSLMEDQEAILDQMVSIARDERVDAVLIAGDVYQRSAPQAEAMALFDRFVSQLAEMGMKVFVISGNHDSALRISYFSRLVRSSGVYVSEEFTGAMQGIPLKDAYGEMTVWLLPFLTPARVKRLLPEKKIVTYQDAVAAVLAQTPIDTRGRNVLVCHQFITGCATSDSEERAVGGLDNVDAALFDGFDYVALGHIHRPQRMLRDTLRYAGSPLKYSFSEAGQSKSAVLVTLGEKGDVEVRTSPLYPLHDVRLVEGSLEQLQDLPYSEDYIWATVHDELVPPDARVSLSANMPNMLKFSVVNSKTKYDRDVLAAERMESKPVDELFADFYTLQHNGQAPGEEHMRVVRRVLRELEETP